MNKIIKLLVLKLYQLRIFFILEKKISRIHAKIRPIKNISDAQYNKHKSIWFPISRNPNKKWYEVYHSINNISDPNYISEYVYYATVEPTLNNKAFSEAYADKNYYRRIIKQDLLPDTYLRRISGSYYDEEYFNSTYASFVKNILPVLKEFIVKKSTDTGGGRDVDLFSLINGNWINQNTIPFSEEYLLQNFGSNFIIQQLIKQHDSFARFNSSSVNTIRLFTYRSVSSNEVVPLHAILRIGTPGSIVDNQASGGFACGIDSSGHLIPFAINKNGGKVSSINGINLSDKVEVFKYSKIVELGCSLAKLFPYHRLLGFDFCITSEGKVVLLEVNNKNNEINFYQMNNGPLFKNYTQEVIDFCSENKKSFVIDFEL